MTIAEIIKEIESNFPLSSQESYDNCGLLFGQKSMIVENVLVCLDVTENVVKEAIQKNCQLIISHHPLIFSPFKRLSESIPEHRSLIWCIQENVAVYALHTNLDNSQHGVNAKIGQKLNVKHPRILQGSKNTLKKLVVYVPNKAEYIDALDQALFEFGAGKIGNYEECHFRTEGIGTFKPIQGANPTIGTVHQREKVSEVKLEYLVSTHQISNCLKAMIKAHPYEEIAHEIFPMDNINPSEGAGMIGELEVPLTIEALLENVKNTFGCEMVRHTCKHLTEEISKIAWCGGSGAFLIDAAKSQGAQVFLTSDVKYHDFFKAEGSFNIVDIGHYENEQFTIDLIADFLKEKFTKFAIHLTEINTNPINYK